MSQHHKEIIKSNPNTLKNTYAKMPPKVYTHLQLCRILLYNNKHTDIEGEDVTRYTLHTVIHNYQQHVIYLIE